MANKTAYDQWLRAKVREALNDQPPDVTVHEVEAEFAERRVKDGTQITKSIGALEGTRTPNLLIRSEMLYPLSYERNL